jgi:hypothetical protein
MVSMTRRTALILLSIVALASWAALLLFTHAVAPATPVAFVVFFAILLVALTSTIAMCAYGLGSLILHSRLFTSKRHHASIRGALRQGTLLALAIIFNLVLRALNSWNMLTALAILLVAVVIEAAVQSRG